MPVEVLQSDDASLTVVIAWCAASARFCALLHPLLRALHPLHGENRTHLGATGCTLPGREPRVGGGSAGRPRTTMR